MVHAVGRDDDRRGRCEPRPQAGGGVLAHRDQRAGAARADADHRREERDLAALVPLGMVEEREVVHGDDRGDRQRAAASCSAARARRRARAASPGWERSSAPREGGPAAGREPRAGSRPSARGSPSARPSPRRASRCRSISSCPASPRTSCTVYTPAPTGCSGTAETSSSRRTRAESTSAPRGSAAACVRVEVGLCGGIPGEVLSPPVPTSDQVRAGILVVDQVRRARGSQRRDVAGGDEAARVRHHLGERRRVRGDDRAPSRHRLEHGEPESLVAGGQRAHERARR